MIATITAFLVRKGLKEASAGRLAWIAVCVAVALLLGGAMWAAIALVYRTGSDAGAARVEVTAARAHTAAIADVRQDEQGAQRTVDAIGARVARVDDVTTELVRKKISEINDAVDATPPPVDGAAGLFPADRVSASLNALVDRANRAAAAADAQP